MKVFYSDKHALHFPTGELHGGQLVTPFERPSRMDTILGALAAAGFEDVATPGAPDHTAITAVHDADYVDFLRTAWDEWRAEGFEGDAIATSFAVRRMTQRVPNNIDGRIGYYSFAAETAITEGTWNAALASCAVAQDGARAILGGQSSAFALCRPPGHHAARDLFGGYCFINNAAVAARMFTSAGNDRVAVLDIDFHHGNGTQDIFYESDDVLFCSLHGQPEDAFPFFSGYADERGSGKGEGATINYPMPPGTPWARWSEALASALEAIRRHDTKLLVVSLGVDTFEDDPISFFKLRSEDYLRAGALIAGAGVPTLFVMEGGYAIDAIGTNTVNVLSGFLNA